MKIHFTAKAFFVCFIFLLSANGLFGQQPVLAWAKSLGGNYAMAVGRTDMGYSTVTDSAGNVYTGGYFFGYSVDLDPGPGVFNVTGNNYTNIFILKLDANGNFIWAKSIGSNGDEGINSMSLDMAGHILITGFFDTQADFDPNGGIKYLYPNGGFDVFVLKLDTTGNFIWAKSFGSSTDEQYGKLATDGAGNVYLTGSFKSPTDFNPGSGVYILTPANYPNRNNPDIYILKLNAAGNFVWAYSFGGDYEDYGTAITVDNVGNVYAAGSLKSSSQVDLDPGPATYILTGGQSGCSFILKLNSFGNFVWAKAFYSKYNTGYGDSYINGITNDQNGNVYTAGAFNQKLDLNPGSDTFYVTSNNNLNDLFISKLDSMGNFVWAKQVGGSRHDLAEAIKIDSAGSIYITGFFAGTVDFDPGVGVNNLTSTGTYSSSDVFILKLDENGNFLWAGKVGGKSDDITFAELSIDISNNIILTGNFRDTANFDPGSGTYNLISKGTDDIFILKLSPQNILPLSLLNFTAIKRNNNNLLQWTVENEQNFDRYQIERSINGKDFNAIGSIKAIHERQYTFTDNNPTNQQTTPNNKPQTIFYRLKMIDKDNTFTYSKIVSVKLPTDNKFTISPNPAKDNIMLQFSKTITGKSTVEITDASGKIMFQKTVEVSGSNMSVSTATLPSGTYTVRLMNNGEEYLQKVVVVR